MATAEGQTIGIRQITRDCEDEKIAELSNGLIFKSQFDVCKNLTVNFMFSPDGDLLSLLEVAETGNQTRNEMEKLEDLMNSHEALETLRDQALERSAMAAAAAF